MTTVLIVAAIVVLFFVTKFIVNKKNSTSTVKVDTQETVLPAKFDLTLDSESPLDVVGSTKKPRVKKAQITKTATAVKKVTKVKKSQPRSIKKRK